MGETAPVLVLVGYSRSINFDIFNGNMASLPLLIYTELTNPEHAGFLRVWGAALTLIIVVARGQPDRRAANRVRGKPTALTGSPRQAPSFTTLSLPRSAT